MEVGIEDCLHIEFEYDRARYHLKDVVVGRIYFLLVRIKLKHMEVGLYVLLVSPAISHQHNQQACAPHAPDSMVTAISNRNVLEGMVWWCSTEASWHVFDRPARQVVAAG
jgi:hypothetical protein